MIKLGRPIALLLSLVLGLAGCASVGGGDGQVLPAELADNVVVVSDQYRPLRVCLMAAGVVEIMTDRIQVFDSSQAPEALGRLQALQGAVDAAQVSDHLWLNTVMTDVALQLAAVLRNAGHEKLSRILIGGPTVGNFINIAQRVTLLVAKGDAVLLDINNMLERVEANTLEEQTVWDACRERMNHNRLMLSILSGVASQ